MDRPRAAVSAVLLPRAVEVVRMVLAAGVAWQLCRWLGAQHPPVYAVIVPIVATRDDPFSAAGVSGSRLLGVLGGVTVGLLLLQVLPLGLPAVLVALAVGLVLGSVHHRGAAMNLQFALSALLVFAAAGSGPGAYALSRLWETAVGAAVTVVLSVVLLPPRPAVAVRAALADFADRAQQLLGRAVDPADRDTPAAAEALAVQAAALDADHRRAVRSARLLPFGRRQRRDLAALAPAVALARSVARHLAALADSVQDIADRDPYTEQIVALRPGLRRITDPLGAAVHAALTGGPAGPDRLRATEELLAFRSADPGVLPTILRHPLRRTLDDLARFDGDALAQLA
jgi:uncharacterized membrane protein YccC